MTMQAIPRGGYKQQPRRIPRSLGFAKHALNFDGVDDYVEVPYSASLNLTDVLTVEAWIKPDVLSGGNRVVAKGWTNSYELAIHDGGQIHTVLGGAAYIVDSPPGLITVGNWHHIVLTWDKADVGGSNIKVYHNGTLVATGNRTTSLPGNTLPLRIGVRTDGFLEWFDGLIAGVEIYKRALSAEERKWNMLNYHNPIRSGLVLWLPMEEGQGEIVYDKSGKGNHGTLLPAGAGPTWQRLRQWELRAVVE